MIDNVLRGMDEPRFASAELPSATAARVLENAPLDTIEAQVGSRFGMLARYWRSIRRDGALTPGRYDFDPTAIPRLLPNIHLMEFVDDDHLIYRLSGHEEVRRIGQDLKGVNYFDHIDRDAEQLARRVFPRLFRHGCGVIVSATEVYDDGSSTKADYLGLPLAQDGVPARFLISVVDSDDAAENAPLRLTDRPVLWRDHILAIQPVDIGAGVPDLDA